MNSAAAGAGLAVRKTVNVDAPIDVAFGVFTHRIEYWWPMASHHIGEAECAVVIIEPRRGGRWYERGVNGVECEWGRVLLWDAPQRIVLLWQLNSQWQFDASLRTEVDVRFIAVDPRRTRVELEHRGLEAYGADAGTMRDTFDSPNGWTGMLDHYAVIAGQDPG